MAMTTTGSPVSVADRLQTYFSRKLLEIQVDELRMDQFGMQADLPKNVGGRTMRFFKFEKAGGGSGQFSASPGLYGASPTLTTDTVGKFAIGGVNEGVAVSTFRENATTKVDVSLEEYVQATKISDVMSLIDAYEPLKQNIDLMGRDAALFYDSMARNCIVGSTHPDGSSTPLTHGSNGTNGCEMFVNASGTLVNSGTSSTNFATLSGLTKAQGKAFRGLIVAAGTRLRVNKAPKLNGGFVFLLPPQLMNDLCQDSHYETAFQGRGNDGVFKGQIGQIDGFRFVEHTNPFIEDETYGSYDSADDDGDGFIYTGLALGRGAYGVPKIAGTKSPLKPQVFISDGAEKVDPANQYVVAAWKAFLMGVGLDSANLVAVRAKSTFA